MLKSIILVVLLGVVVTQGFLIGSKFKNGCEPNHCKHKSKCVLDVKNANLSTCVCTDGYHGKLCDLKTGCQSTPCKKGVCTNDRVNPSNYTCKCQNGIVGKNCEHSDPCLKNPCKTGTCKLDDKYKAQCVCLAGWGTKSCDKRNCTVEQYKGKQFSKSSNKIFLDKTIHKKVESLEGLAKLCKVKIHVLRSFILHPDPKAIAYDTKDKTNPNHYIGQAISFEIYGEDDKLACNDICLAKIPIPVPAAKCFVDGLHAIQWKWSILDPTVVHTGYQTANYKDYNHLRESHQVGCRDLKQS